MRLSPRIPRTLSWSVLVALIAAAPAVAQSAGTVTGTVSEKSSGRPLSGVQVFIPGTSAGAISNETGKYLLLNVPAGQRTVRAQIIGYATVSQQVTVTAGQTTTANFSLEQSVISLDQVVVTGAGAATEKKKLGNTIATLDATKLQDAPVVNVSEMLQGREPGVVGAPGSGMAGEGSQIRIRGSASLSQSNEPIVYVDGVRVDNSGGDLTYAGPSRLDDIDPESIDHIEILKGAAAATLYGTEASNGVIQIFTKHGSQGSTRWTFQTEQAADLMPDRYHHNSGFARTAAQAANISQIWGVNVQPYEVFSVPIEKDMYASTGYGSTYSLSASGGTDNVTYFVSGRYAREDGPWGSNKFDVGPSNDLNSHKQGVANLTFTASDKLRLRVSSQYAEANSEVPGNGNDILSPATLAMFAKPENANCGASSVAGYGRCSGAGNPLGAPAFATIREATYIRYYNQASHYNGSIGANYQLLPSVGLESTFGVDYVNERNTNKYPFGYVLDDVSGYYPSGYKYFSTDERRNISLDAKGNWINNFTPDVSSTMVVGVQGYVTRTHFGSEQGYDFPGPGLDVASAGTQSSYDIGESLTDIVNLGVFGQEQIGWKDWAFFTAGVRYDKNSAFGQNTAGAVYPKASVSIVPTDAGWNIPGINTLRLRAAVGQSGLQPGAFDKFTTFSPVSAPDGSGLAPDNLGNPDLKPEVSTEWEGGGEIGFLNNRASLELTYWNRTVQDALVKKQYQPTGGFTSTQLTNLGQLKAHGWEVGLRSSLYNSASTQISLFANAAYLHEIVSDMGGAAPIKVGGSYPRYRNYIKEGYAPGAMFGAALPMPCSSSPAGANVCLGAGQVPFDTNGDGVPDTEDQLKAYLANPDKNSSGGILGFDDAKLQPMMLAVACPEGQTVGCGGVLDNYLGKPSPDWTGSFGGDITFLKNLTFSTLFEWKAGNFGVTNLTDAFRKANGGIGRNTPEAAAAEAEMLNPSSTPEQRFDAAMTWAYKLRALSPYSGLNTIYSGDFMRWREASLTWNAPQTMVSKIGIGVKGMSLGVTGRNLMLWTSYPGTDPEINLNGRCNSGSSASTDCNFAQSLDAFGIALMRRFSFTARVNF